VEILTDTDDDYDLDDDDRDALTRAIDVAGKEPGRAEQLTDMLKSQPWEEVASFAARCAQDRELNLYPWQQPPCRVDEDDVDGDEDDAARALLRRMLAAGLSRYEPEPLKALGAKRRRRRKAKAPT
jgi:hypothetical protein